MVKTRKLLLIDDDRVQQRLMLQLVKNFRSGPFELDEATAYDDGLRKLLSGKYAACMLDYRLGDRDGLALLREARIAGSETPVIVLTADDSEEVDLAAMDAGAADYLVKGGLTPRLLERSLRYALKLDATLAQLRQLAQRDELTKLFNRREFQRILLEEWDRAVRFAHPFSLVMVDIDHFKRINDTYGHQTGDEVLRHVSSLLAGQVRNVDRVARYGGEEFAVLLPGCSPADATKVAESIRLKVEQWSDKPGVTTVSIGVASITPVVTMEWSGLVEAADKALYTAKRNGRNQSVAATPASLSLVA